MGGHNLVFKDDIALAIAINVFCNPASSHKHRIRFLQIVCCSALNVKNDRFYLVLTLNFLRPRFHRIGVCPGDYVTSLLTKQSENVRGRAYERRGLDLGLSTTRARSSSNSLHGFRDGVLPVGVGRRGVL
ncbi:hypothetical protein CDAR_407351 [Caerostris darwini]|uniref:Uncharacterized protein n=1 Tax=Caerostris darwini TaxID=1538125 RepID=A0AAV4Q419_9ARAC|nr:hypothetical protein CDAR_407351 [Caerostris darwini]